jgi:hypothetical protein
MLCSCHYVSIPQKHFPLSHPHNPKSLQPILTDYSCQTIATHLSTLGYTIHFLTAPHSIAGTPYTVARQSDHQPGDLERSWWTTSDVSSSHPNLAPFLSTVAAAITQHGPFTALLGFSQGGCAATSIAALLEPSRRGTELTRTYLTSRVLAIQPPLAFLLLFSANPYRFPRGESNDLDVLPLFYPRDFKDYPYQDLSVPTVETLVLSSGKGSGGMGSEESFSNPPAYQSECVRTPSSNTISTPTLFFYGAKEWATDPFSRARQQWFISRFDDLQVQGHPWKHTVPRTDAYAGVVVEFVSRLEMKLEGKVKAVL